MAVFRVVLALAVLGAPFAAAQATTSGSSSIMSGIDTLVGASFDPSAASATRMSLGTTVAGLQTGFSAIPAASSAGSAAAGNGTATSAAAASSPVATGFQGLLSSLGSQYTSVIKPTPTLPAGLEQTIQSWSVPHVDVGSFVLNPTAFDLSDLYAALNPTNFPYCTPAVYTPAVLNPAVVIAPSTSVKIDTGSCQVNDDDSTVTCYPPKMTYQQVPFTYTSPFYTASTWTDTECIIAKNLTQPSTEVLYSGGADVTFPTVAAWLATFNTPTTTDLSLQLGPAGFVPVNAAPSTVSPLSTLPPPPAGAFASANSSTDGNTTTTGTTVSAGRRLAQW